MEFGVQVPGFGEVIRLSVVDDSTLVSSHDLRQSKIESRNVLQSISLFSHGPIIYIATNVTRIDETRVLRTGIDLYRVDASRLCASSKQ